MPEPLFLRSRGNAADTSSAPTEPVNVNPKAPENQKRYILACLLVHSFLSVDAVAAAAPRFLYSPG